MQRLACRPYRHAGTIKTCRNQGRRTAVYAG
jgi:hypothetical protein